MVPRTGSLTSVMFPDPSWTPRRVHRTVPDLAEGPTTRPFFRFPDPFETYVSSPDPSWTFPTVHLLIQDLPEGPPNRPGPQ